ncbi:hypothetical protein BDB00DRAFT_107480 [Zychaea mexicana]|uniref:uncharacterized protein n=1 Tax=Zychaea mexicana TaxID=64656 RepID=UPI0022FE400E|nr:uncharacterized protein BDB00DRAFT_107480 [Zychaea mexicana]KAI9484911.1 hypothetical protein BDB00DRAFT_107480 [Zychaea mexicana]
MVSLIISQLLVLHFLPFSLRWNIGVIRGSLLYDYTSSDSGGQNRENTVPVVLIVCSPSCSMGPVSNFPIPIKSTQV